MIRVRGLRREFGDLVALEDLTLDLDAGDTFGFIGPNGAGKTTTMRIMATLLAPTSGAVEIGGHDVVRDYRTVRRIVGYMPDFFGIYDDMQVWEYLDFFAAAYRIPARKRRRLVEDVLALTDLAHKADAMVDSLSRGMEQRLCLAKTLIHDPQVLILDEPASGLDPRARIELRELIRELRRMGKTVLVSSHILPELADVCTKIGIIERGRLVAFGPVEELTRRVTTGAARARVRMKVAAGAVEAAPVIAAVPGIRDVASEGSVLYATLEDPAADLSALMADVLARGVKLVAFEKEECDLEDVFLTVTRGVVG
jgi:ABC-2 type transport system ATP-binding protein